MVSTIGRGVRALGRVIRGDLTMLAIPAFLASMAYEAHVLHRDDVQRADPGEPMDAPNVDRPLGYEPRDTAASVAMGLGMLVIGTQVGRVLNPIDHRLFKRRFRSMGSGRMGFAGAVVLWDFLYYWSHRFGHEHRVFWAAHVNHHSSTRYNLSTALRQSWTNSISHWIYLPMFLLGYSPSQVARAGELNLLYQYWVHTETIDTLPANVERFLNTASHHRVHHGTNPQYLDRNYGGILILWDRLFGTFEPEDQRVVYGLTTNITSNNPVTIAFHEWRALGADVAAADGWADRVGFILGPPGWAPTSSRGAEAAVSV